MNRLFTVLVLSLLSVTVFSQSGRHKRVYVRPAPGVVNRGPVIVQRPPAYYPYHGVSYRYSGGHFYRPYGSYWRIAPPPIGVRVNVLPYGYTPLYVGPSMYYYNDGTYYRKYDDRNYEVVDPPMGATLSSLPKGATSVQVNGEPFYELNGTYYKQTTNEKGKTVFVVTGKNGEINNSALPEEENFIPQVGDIVDQLPENYKTITLNGATYYVAADDTYYQSIQEDGNTRYEVVSTPSGATDVKQ